MMSDAAILKILWWQTILDLVGIRSFVLTENSSSRISLSIVSDLNRYQKVIVFGETNSDKPLWNYGKSIKPDSNIEDLSHNGQYK